MPTLVGRQLCSILPGGANRYSALGQSPGFQSHASKTSAQLPPGGGFGESYHQYFVGRVNLIRSAVLFMPNAFARCYSANHDSDSNEYDEGRHKVDPTLVAKCIVWVDVFRHDHFPPMLIFDVSRPRRMRLPWRIRQTTR